MDTHGYRLAGNARTVSPDYIPSLIGVAAKQMAPEGTDTYFERIEVGSIEITAITITRWVSYDSLPLRFRDPILGVKGEDGRSFYIPFTELRDRAAELDDFEVMAMLRSLPAIPSHML